MSDPAIITREWAKAYQLPEPGNMMESHAKREQVFVNQGTAMAQAMLNAIETCSGRSIGDLKVLDFGCGVGRVAMPLFFHVGKPDACVDVDPAAIAYLATQIPGAAPQCTAPEPPLPFPAASFDAVFALSVWTHLDRPEADAWLAEMVRILRPGGHAFLTTSNYAVLEVRRNVDILARMGWDAISDAVLREKGFVFIETPSPPGTGRYGLASHDPEFVRSDWSRHMPVIDIISGGILGKQDINVLRKPGPA
ncbi:MAG: methyltransferase domain-containing protein [Marinibacterium sp.]